MVFKCISNAVFCLFSVTALFSINIRIDSRLVGNVAEPSKTIFGFLYLLAFVLVVFVTTLILVVLFDGAFLIDGDGLDELEDDKDSFLFKNYFS